jgi:hypothetical protein
LIGIPEFLRQISRSDVAVAPFYSFDPGLGKRAAMGFLRKEAARSVAV